MFLGLLVVVFTWGVIGFIGKIQITRENKKIAENKVAQLKQEKEQFSLNIAKLQTDEGVEESIRDKFGLAKEGEGMIVIVEDRNKANEQKEESSGFWNFVKSFFK